MREKPFTLIWKPYEKALHVEQQRQTLLDQDARTISHISQLNQQYEHLEVLIRQRKVLISQYESDAARLDLQLQAMKHARTHAYPTTCQFRYTFHSHVCAKLNRTFSRLQHEIRNTNSNGPITR